MYKKKKFSNEESKILHDMIMKSLHKRERNQSYEEIKFHKRGKYISQE